MSCSRTDSYEAGNRTGARELELKQPETLSMAVEKVVCCFVRMQLREIQRTGALRTVQTYGLHRALSRSTPLLLSSILNKASAPEVEKLCQSSVRRRLKKNTATRPVTVRDAATLAGTAMLMALAFAVGLSAGSNPLTRIEVGTLI